MPLPLDAYIAMSINLLKDHLLPTDEKYFPCKARAPSAGYSRHSSAGFRWLDAALQASLAISRLPGFPAWGCFAT